MNDGAAKGKGEMKSNGNESPKAAGKFIKVESQKVAGPMMMLVCGIVLPLPIMLLDAYLVHRFPKLFPHYLLFTSVVWPLYMLIAIWWQHFSSVAAKRTIGEAIVMTCLCLSMLVGMPLVINANNVLPECVQNLWEIQTAKVEWMTANHKKEYDTPTWDDIKPYLRKRGWKGGLPVCPDGGKYTLGRVGERPTCSIGGYEHWLPSTVEPPRPKVRYGPEKIPD